MSADRAAVRYCVRADARRSWRAWVVLGVLVGLAAGVVLGAAAGARRTSSAYQDLLAETAAVDVAVYPACGPQVRDCPTAVDLAEDLRATPGVAGAGALASVLTPIRDDEGIWETQGDPCNTGTGETSVIVPLDDHTGDDVLRLRILEGRDVDPTSHDEAVLAPEAAAVHGVELGDVLQVHLGPGVACEDPTTWGEATDLTVVGIGLSGLEVPPKTGFFVQGLHVSPALATDMPAVRGPDTALVGIRLEDGATLDEVNEAVGPPGVIPAFDRVEDLRGDEIDAGLRSDANALWLVVVLGSIAAAFVVGPTLARYRSNASAVDRTLAAFGWSRRDRVLRSAIHALAISAMAVIVATVVAFVASFHTPIGDARNIEPHPGPELDLPVLLLGGLAVSAVVVLGLGALAWRPPMRSTTARRTPLAAAAARLGLPTRTVLGLRVGLEPGPHQAPVRSSVLAIALGTAGVIGVLVYTAGAQHLRETPAWRGVPWDDVVLVGEADSGVELAETARSWPEVDRVSTALVFNYPLVLGEDHLPATIMVLSTGAGSTGPTVIDGRAPATPDELLVNPLLAEDLGLEVGDEVTAAFDLAQATQDPEAGTSPSFTLRMVGTGPVPIGDGRFEQGAVLTRDGYIAQLERFAPPEDLEGSGTQADALMIDRAPGTTHQDLTERFAEVGVRYTFEENDAKEFLDNVVSADPTSTEAAPDLLAALMAVMSLMVLGYGVSLSVLRNGKDLAVTRALGLTPRLLRSTSRWAGFAFVSAALVVAVPVGLVVGRLAWRSYAEGLGVVADPQIPVLEIVFVVVVGLLVAGAFGGVAARWQARTTPGAALRSE